MTHDNESSYGRYEVLIPFQGDVNLFHQTEQIEELGTTMKGESMFSLTVYQLQTISSYMGPHLTQELLTAFSSLPN